jgi:hypothetical protein
MATQLTAQQKAARENSQALARMASAKHEDILPIFGNEKKADKFVTDLKLLALNTPRGILHPSLFHRLWMENSAQGVK